MQFENVAVVKKANVYYDGKVSSRTIKFADGSEKTLGFMLAGEYNFSTGKPEVMEVLSGDAKYKLANTDEWVSVKEGESFNVAGNSKFDIIVDNVLDYCCSFVTE